MLTEFLSNRAASPPLACSDIYLLARFSKQAAPIFQQCYAAFRRASLINPTESETFTNWASAYMFEAMLNKRTPFPLASIV